MNKVTDVSMGIRNNNPKGRVTGYKGVCVAFDTNDSISIRKYVKVADHSFEVHAININEDKSFDVEAHEVGYYARKFDRNDDFDIRSLLGAEVSIVIDEKEIKKIVEESGWC